LNIPIEALDRGAKLARDNAWQFLGDAELLLSHNSCGHAAALALYGLEEHAKMWVPSVLTNRKLPCHNTPYFHERSECRSRQRDAR